MAGGDYGTSSSVGGRKAVDVDFNLVPFIDMMTVLVSFLLITAVWSNLAQINSKPGGLGRDTETPPPQPPPINLSVLIAQDGLWAGITTGQPIKIDKNPDGSYNWEALGEVLDDFKNKSGIFNERDDIEIAAEDKVDYQTVITTMDTAVTKQFKSIRYLDPASLSVRFKQ